MKEGNRFTMGEIEVAEGVVISLDADAELIFDNDSDGDATFVGGQVGVFAVWRAFPCSLPAWCTHARGCV